MNLEDLPRTVRLCFVNLLTIFQNKKKSTNPYGCPSESGTSSETKMYTDPFCLRVPRKREKTTFLIRLKLDREIHRRFKRELFILKWKFNFTVCKIKQILWRRKENFILVLRGFNRCLHFEGMRTMSLYHVICGHELKPRRSLRWFSSHFLNVWKFTFLLPFFCYRSPSVVFKNLQPFNLFNCLY